MEVSAARHGRLLATTVVETLMRLPRAQRTSGCLLIIEEAGELIHEPFLRYLGAVRKYGCRMVFCGQDLATFQKPTKMPAARCAIAFGL